MGRPSERLGEASTVASLDRFFTPRTLVACHDAGAAQMILDNTSEVLLRDCRLALRGPATKIFSGYDSVDVDGPLLDPSIDNVITGTGWQDTLEFNALHEASLSSTPSVAVVDRATNFELRFSRGGDTVEPTIILIPEYELSKLPSNVNRANLVGFIDDSRRRQLNQIMRQTTDLETLDSLFIGQPLVDTEGVPDFEIQYRFLRHWLDGQGAQGSIGFRPHPSDQSTLPPDIRDRVTLSDLNVDAAEDISRAREVVGIESFLLELSAQAGKTTFRCLERDGRVAIEELWP